MRKAFFDSARRSEPFTALHVAGAKPSAVKEAIVRLLDPYVRDKELLQSVATSALAAEAISVGRLLSRSDWKDIFDLCFKVREDAFDTNEHRAAQVTSYFESAIREAQRNFALLVVFEAPRDELTLDEFAFDLLRNLGVLVESNVQIYLKELYGLLLTATGEAVDLQAVAAEDFGRVCESLEKRLPNATLLRPHPWKLRVNQWRNIAQHHSFTVAAELVTVAYGKTRPQKQLALSRNDLLTLGHELMIRLGALKSSRALAMLNHTELLEMYLPTVELDQYNHATALAASLATQGFRLLDLQADKCHALAVLEDVAPTEGNVRRIHCSQFVALVADRFPRVAVQVHYIVAGRHLWTFEASAHDLERVMALEDPLSELAHIVRFVREP